MLNFAFKYFNLDYKKFILSSKSYYRKKDIKSNSSDYKSCLIRNNILRKSKIYGEKIISKIIEHQLNN